MIRVPPIETWKIVAEALNYKTVTINWGDLYPAIQTGVCDGWIAGTPSWNYIAFKDLLKFYIPYNTTVDSTAFIMSMDKWNSLSPEEQKIFDDAFTTAAASSRETARKDDAGFISQMEEKGIKIIRLTDDETRTIAKKFMIKCGPHSPRPWEKISWTAWIRISNNSLFVYERINPMCSSQGMYPWDCIFSLMEEK